MATHWNQASRNPTQVRPLLIRPQANVSAISESINISQQKRTRAKHCCDSCRERRIRCNAESVQPCYGCRKFGVECNFSEDYKPSAKYIRSVESRILHLESLLNKRMNDARTTKGARLSGKDGVSIYQKLVYGSANATLELVEDNMPLNDYGATRYIGSSAGAHLLDAFKTHQRYRISGQSSFLLENINMNNEELVIAKAKGVQKPSMRPQITQNIKVFQDIPGLNEEFVDQLIEAYFIFVHPSVPVLNKLSFLQQYYYQNPGPPDEYLISTICAIGVNFMFFDGDFVAGSKVDRKTLNSIHRHLQDKAIKILGIAHRHPQISTLQTLLLLAIFITVSAGDDNEEASMHWMIIGTAINMAQDLGLHRDGSRLNLPPREIELRRRLWYTVYSVDAWIAAELGRPITIPDYAFDVKLPSLYEIDSQCHTFNENDTVANRPVIISQVEASLRDQTPEYQLFFQIIMLTKMLRRVLGSLYSSKTYGHVENYIGTIDSLDSELKEWKSNLPLELQPEDIKSNLITSCYGAILFVFYNCVTALLHRPLLENPKTADITHSIRAQSECMTAAINIIDTLEAVIPFVSSSINPRSFVAYSLFQSSIVFMIYANSENENERRIGCHCLARCAALYAMDGSQYHNARIFNQIATMLGEAQSASVKDNLYHIYEMTTTSGDKQKGIESQMYENSDGEKRQKQLQVPYQHHQHETEDWNINDREEAHSQLLNNIGAVVCSMDFHYHENMQADGKAI